LTETDSVIHMNQAWYGTVLKCMDKEKMQRMLKCVGDGQSLANIEIRG